MIVQNQAPLLTSEKNIFTVLRNHNQLDCPICYHDYNTTNRVPIVLCSSQHTICRRCLKEIKKALTRSKRKCPLCKQGMKNQFVKKNRLLCQIIQVFTSLKLQDKNENPQDNQDCKSQKTISINTQDQRKKRILRRKYQRNLAQFNKLIEKKHLKRKEQKQKQKKIQNQNNQQFWLEFYKRKQQVQKQRYQKIKSLKQKVLRKIQRVKHKIKYEFQQLIQISNQIKKLQLQKQKILKAQKITKNKLLKCLRKETKNLSKSSLKNKSINITF